MNFMNVADISLFSSVILVIILVSIHRAEKRLSIHKRRFTHLIWATIALLLLDFIAWNLNGRRGGSAATANYWVNFIYLACNPLPVVFWLRYLDSRTPYTFVRKKYRPLLFLPVIISTGILIANLQSGFVFTITADSLYQRGSGMYYFSIINMMPLLYPLFKNRGHYNQVEIRLTRVLFAFSLLPIAGAVLQIAYYGTSLIYSSTTIGILITYVFLELQSSQKDYLTGLSSRSQIDDLIHVRLERSKNHFVFGLIMIDLDHFKEINDTFGHIEGDQTLVIFSNLLTRTFKRQDCIARFGGDEFLILIDDADSEIMARVLKRLDDNVREFNRKKVKPYQLRFSAGYVIYNPEQHSDYHMLLQDADQRMYNQKRSKLNGTDINKIIWL